MVMLLGVSNIIVSFPLRWLAFRNLENNCSYLSVNAFALRKSFSVALGFMLLLVSYRLLKKEKSAWIVSVAMIAVSLFLNLHHFYRIKVISAAEIFILLMLILLHGEFNHDLNPASIRRGLLLDVMSFSMVGVYTAIGIISKRHFFGPKSFWLSVADSVRIFYFMDFSPLRLQTKLATVSVAFAVVLNWMIIILALLLILKPLIYHPIATVYDREKVRGLQKQFGFNPVSYLAVEDDKKYFFSALADGAIAYTIVNRVVICAGDPICKKTDMPVFLKEFLAFCKKKNYQICFCQITGYFMNICKSMGFGFSKYGEECMFELSKYSLEGHKASRLRQALRRAEKLGIRVLEYDPRLQRNIELEKQILCVSSEWLAQKKSGELTFMLGTVSLENPGDRRYFVAVDGNNEVQGFIVFVPFMGGAGYMADVTRRKSTAPFGVMEKLTVDAFFLMRDEGVKWGSLGLAPLYNVRNQENRGIINEIFNFIYENLNRFYGFKSLYQYKQKYVPTKWEPRYLAYYPRFMTPQIGYSIVKAQNPKGLSDYLLTNLRRKVKVNR